MSFDEQEIPVIADKVSALLGTGGQTAPFSESEPAFDLSAAYRVTAALQKKREANGARALGRKIGFTNRLLWEEFGVFAPIWGHVYDQTVRDLDGEGAEFALAGLAEPRIEPEIVFGFDRAPEASMDDEALARCVGWVALGFEIVQSIYPGWRFAAADAVAGAGMHGALLIGPRHGIDDDPAGWASRLAAFEINLLCDGEIVDQGRAGNVMDGPLSAVRHLVDLLAADAGNANLAAGEIVTTGSLTKALPVAPGQRWSTALRDIELQGIEICFT